MREVSHLLVFKEAEAVADAKKAREAVAAQLVASSVASRPLSSDSFQQPSQAAVPNLQSSLRIFSLSSFQWYLFFVVALLFAVVWLIPFSDACSYETFPVHCLCLWAVSFYQDIAEKSFGNNFFISFREFVDKSACKDHG